MQLGSFTVPPIAAAAVLGAGVLVILVLWGVWRARRVPAPAPLPVAPPVPTPGPHPCAEDWTGERAGGPADPPAPVRPRTVADAVAERGDARGVDQPPPDRNPADAGSPGTPSGPVPEPAAVQSTVPMPVPAAPTGRHAAAGPSPADTTTAPDDGAVAPSDERPDAFTVSRTAPDAPWPPVPGRRPVPFPYPPGRTASGDAAPGTGPDAAPDTGPDIRPDTAPDPRPRTVPPTAAATASGTAPGTGPDTAGTGADTAAATGPDAAPDTTDTTRAGTGHQPVPGTEQEPAQWSPAADGSTRAGTRLRVVDDAHPGAPEQPGVVPGRPAADAGSRPDDPTVADDLAVAPLPPWSTERTLPAMEDLPSAGPAPSGRRPDPDDVVAATGTGDTFPGTTDPMPRAVQQALAARAVHSARLRRTGFDDAGSCGGDQQELPLAVVPSPSPAPVTGPDARDRLLGVLLADPGRAVDATETLDASRDRIEQLGDVLRRRRAELAGAVRHLHDCGLDPVQIGRLSGMPATDVRTILDGRADDGAAGDAADESG
ncbi:hypothetical protein AFB00_09045 [Pseudonocardia sp. HH130630-07]|nr:hypothetical protein AFB00_09045 [Pseudonocardia sp. HH130630-07]